MASTLQCVSPKKTVAVKQFCLTDCSPSEGCQPDRDCTPDDECRPDDKCKPDKTKLI